MPIHAVDQREQIRKAEAFHAMHHGARLLLLPNAWDGMSARIFQKAGFEAIGTTSGGVAWSLGFIDGEAVPSAEMVSATRRIVSAVDVPVTADIEAGFGTDAAAVYETVAAVIRTGAVGINLEDGLDNHRDLRSVADAVSRIGAAREAAKALGVPIVVNARIDVFLRAGGTAEARMTEAVERARAYMASGADCVYPIGLSKEQDIATFAAAVRAPVNVWAKPGMPDAAALQRLGVARVSTATAPALSVAAHLQGLAGMLRERGSFDCLSTPLGHAAMQDLMK